MEGTKSVCVILPSLPPHPIHPGVRPSVRPPITTCPAFARFSPSPPQADSPAFKPTCLRRGGASSVPCLRGAPRWSPARFLSSAPSCLSSQRKWLMASGNEQYAWHTRLLLPRQGASRSIRGHLAFPSRGVAGDRGRNARWTLGPGCLRPPPRQPRGGTRKSVRDRRGSPKFPSLGLGSALPRRRDEAPLSLCSPPVRRGVTSPPHGLGRRPLLLRPSTRAAANSDNFLILTNCLFI